MLSAEQYREAEFGYTLKESQKGFVAHVIVFGLVMTVSDRDERVVHRLHGRRFPVGDLSARRLGHRPDVPLRVRLSSSGRSSPYRRHKVEEYAAQAKQRA